MSFSDTVKEAKATFAATAEIEKAPDVDANLAQATVFQAHETQHAVPQNDTDQAAISMWQLRDARMRTTKR
jgi:hypothetical protein